MITAEYDFFLPVEPRTAFDYLANPVNDPQWQDSCEAAEMLDDAVVDTGSHYAVTFRFLGRRMQFVAEITEFAPPNSFSFCTQQGPFHYDGHYVFSTEQRGTRVHWQFNAEPGGFFGLIPGGLLRKVLVSQVQKDSARLPQIIAAREHARAAA